MIRQEDRFDNVGEQDADGYVDYAYHGYTYLISIAGQDFQVRTYDDEPGSATVVHPTTAHQLPQARDLVSFIISELGCTRVQFYHAQAGKFCPVDVQTFDFR